MMVSFLITQTFWWGKAGKIKLVQKPIKETHAKVVPYCENSGVGQMLDTFEITKYL